MRRKDEPTKASPQSMAYPKPVSPRWWVFLKEASEFSKECRAKAQTNPDAPNEMELMKENLRLRKELEEARKENLFLKKQRHCRCSLSKDRGTSLSGINTKGEQTNGE